LPAVPAGDPEFYDFEEGKKKGVLPMTPEPVNGYRIFKLANHD